MKNRQWYILILGLLAIVGIVKAQPLILREQFSAEPTAKVSEGKMHVHSSHDISSPFDILPWDKGAFETRKYRNLFAEMGYKQSDIDAKLKEVFDGLLRLFAMIHLSGNYRIIFPQEIENL